MSAKLKKIGLFLSIAMILVFLFSVSSCKSTAIENDANTIVIDGLGEDVSLDKPAERLIVMAPSALEIIDGLGEIDRVVEVDSFSVQISEPLAEGFEGIGDSQSLNVEKIIELGPDIIITLPGGPEEDYQKIEQAGIEIYRTLNIDGIEGVYTEIENIGSIIGLTEEGKGISNKLKKDVDLIYDKVKDLEDSEKPGVFYEVWNDPLMSAGTDTFINDLITRSGGMNILANDNVSGWAEYSVESLIEENPDILIAPMSVAYDPTIITGDERLSGIDAILNGKVYIVPDNPVSRPSQNIIKGLEMFARAIHPDIFGDFKIIE